MKLVVNPNKRNPSRFSAVEPPLWAGLTAAYHNAELIDAEGLNLSLDQTEYEIRRREPEQVIIVVMGNNPSVSSTPKMPVAEALAARLKRYKVSLTGIHPIAAGSKYPVIRKPFEGMPDMKWADLPMENYRAHNWHCLDGSPRSPYASVYTSLGCPFSCYYCNIHTLYGDRKIQFRPVENIVKEVDLLATKYKVRNIKFWDELFALDEKRVIQICDAIKDYRLNIWAYARLDRVTPAMLAAMKRGGINWVAYGFEDLLDRKFVARTHEVIKETKAAGINIIANFMFGTYGQTDGMMQACLDFAKHQLFEYVNFYVARPYPGSQWWADTKPKMKPEDYDQYGTNRMAFRDSAFREYFTNPAYLSMIRNKFGEQAVKHIGAMLDD